MRTGPVIRDRFRGSGEVSAGVVAGTDDDQSRWRLHRWEMLRSAVRLPGLELEFVGDRLKKGFKRRDAFKGTFATLGALAMATRRAPRHSGARSGVARDCCQKTFPRRSTPPPPPRSARLDVGRAWYGDGQVLRRPVASRYLLRRRVRVEKQLQDLQRFSSQGFDFVAVHPSASDALVDAANQIIAGVPLIDMDTRLVQDPDEFAEFGHLTFFEPDNILHGVHRRHELFKAMGGEGQVIHLRVTPAIPERKAGRRVFTRRWRIT